MKVLEAIHDLSLGGVSKAAARWGKGLLDRGHQVLAATAQDGPRRADFERTGIPLTVCEWSVECVASLLADCRPDVIHLHCPGYRWSGDVFGPAIEKSGRKIPVVQSNIFGRLENPAEDSWVTQRLFKSFTSCVQAARRSFRPLDINFFQQHSVATNPLDPDDGPPESERLAFRKQLGLSHDDIVFGRFSRPEPNKWTDLPLDGFLLALKTNPRIKLLLREPPPEVAARLIRENLGAWLTDPQGSDFSHPVLLLQATPDPAELRLTMSAVDAVLHGSSIGESFGYGIAEPMNFAKPIIVNSTPWMDQAQVEMVPHGKCGFLVSTIKSTARAVLQLADDEALRKKMGLAACIHVREMASAKNSIARLEETFLCAISGNPNPRAKADLQHAREVASFLNKHQFGHSLKEYAALWPLYYRVRFSEWRRFIKRSLHSRNK